MANVCRDCADDVQITSDSNWRPCYYLCGYLDSSRRDREDPFQEASERELLQWALPKGTSVWRFIEAWRWYQGVITREDEFVTYSCVLEKYFLLKEIYGRKYLEQGREIDEERVSAKCISFLYDPNTQVGSQSRGVMGRISDAHVQALLRSWHDSAEHAHKVGEVRMTRSSARQTNLCQFQRGRWRKIVRAWWSHSRASAARLSQVRLLASAARLSQVRLLEKLLRAWRLLRNVVRHRVR